MLTPESRVVVGVSGGADSVCLLLLLREWASRYGLAIRVVHVNHRIRQEAAQDAAFVRDLCGRLGVEFCLVEEDVRERAGREKRSEEEMGRLVRYEAMEREAAEWAADRIAVAHNAEDQAETMLFHLFRGSGLKGLSGISPVRGNVIRPLLAARREEIEAYLSAKGERYCLDATNAEDDYARNRIRHHIIPYAEQEISAGSVLHMCRTAQILADTEEYLAEETKKAATQIVEVVKPEDGSDIPAYCFCGTKNDSPVIYCLDCEGYHRLHPVIGERILLQLLRKLSPGGRDISATHVEMAAALLRRDDDATICLPRGIRVMRCGQKLYFTRVSAEKRVAGEDRDGSKAVTHPEAKRDSSKTVAHPEAKRDSSETVAHPEAKRDDPKIMMRPEVTMDGEKGISRMANVYREVHITKIPGEGLTVDLPGGKTLTFDIFSYKKSDAIPKKKYTKWFDCDKMGESLMLRTRREQDYFSIRRNDGREGRKPLQRWMIDEKIPRQERDEILLLAEKNHILWAMDEHSRISEHYKVTGDTNRILQVCLLADGTDGRC